MFGYVWFALGRRCALPPTPPPAPRNLHDFCQWAGPTATGFLKVTRARHPHKYCTRPPTVSLFGFVLQAAASMLVVILHKMFWDTSCSLCHFGSRQLPPANGESALLNVGCVTTCIMFTSHHSNRFDVLFSLLLILLCIFACVSLHIAFF